MPGTSGILAIAQDFFDFELRDRARAAAASGGYVISPVPTGVVLAPDSVAAC